MENYLNIKFLGKKNPSLDTLAAFQTTKRLYSFKNTCISYFLILYRGKKSQICWNSALLNYLLVCYRHSPLIIKKQLYLSSQSL